MGTYQDEKGQGVCKECLAGKYQDEEKQSSCKVCQGGKYQDLPAQISCKDCEKGKFNNETLPSCDLLTRDHFEYNGQCLSLTLSGPTHKCLESQTLIANIFSAEECAKATYPSWFHYDGSTCYSVVLKTVESPSYWTSYSECRYRSCYRMTMGGVSQLNCNDQDTVSISSNHVYESNLATSCERDSTCSSLTACMDCPTGRHQDQRGQSNCIQCVHGQTYQDERGQENCKEVQTCLPGKYKGLFGNDIS